MPVRRYQFVGPPNTDLTQFIGYAAAQNTTFPIAVVDITINNNAGAILTLDQYMKSLGWVYAPTAPAPPLAVQDEGISTGPNRPALNFIGAGVGAADDPGNGRVNVTIPGSVTGGAVVSRTQYLPTTVSTSSATFVDAMSGTSIPVPIDGDYLIVFEREGDNQNAAGVLEVGISINSLVAAQAGSARQSSGSASDLRWVGTSFVATGLVAGDLIRALFRRPSGAGSVELKRGRLTIIKVQ